MALFKRMDIWSVYDGLDEIMDYLYNGNEKGSIYWDEKEGKVTLPGAAYV